ncbi:MAG: Hydroxylamine oxidoreductase [Steroidobacteraceae bacterium]|nr:Hydroxylamine oxidoreductase [Steroidobacteraceae bacterium]
MKITSSQVMVLVLMTAWGVALTGVARADANTLATDIPEATYDALHLDASASPKQVYDALTKRYYDKAQGAGPGTLAKYWGPIPFTQYMDPADYYSPPPVHITATREQCVACHAGVTPEWVRQWQQSPHANLDKIRALKPGDPTYWKKEQLDQVEANLHSMGKLAAGEHLKQVGCIDCHVAVNDQKAADHSVALRLPTDAVCAECHLKEFGQSESQRDTITWPNDPQFGQAYPNGRPSHALDWKAVAETTVWAAIPQREIAIGCSQCHYNQNKCDGCHTRHLFSTVEARKPEACATCHNGVDHNNIEQYLLSKHGVQFAALGNTWNWNVQLKDAFTKGGQTAPTCQTCHMEYEGKYTHNLVRKSRWGNYPMVPGVVADIKTDWAKQRLAAWVATCSQCHSPKFASAYLQVMDKGTEQGVAKAEEAYDVVQKLYDDKLLPGQLTNRPAPLPPDKDGAHQFFQLFETKGNNPSWADLMGVHLFEDNTSKLHVALAHVSPGGWTYTAGWQQLNETYTKIMNEDERLRARAALEKRVTALEASQKRLSSIFNPDSTGKRAAFGGLGGVMLLAGFALMGRRRRDSRPD